MKRDLVIRLYVISPCQCVCVCLSETESDVDVWRINKWHVSKLKHPLLFPFPGKAPDLWFLSARFAMSWNLWAPSWIWRRLPCAWVSDPVAGGWDNTTGSQSCQVTLSDEMMLCCVFGVKLQIINTLHARQYVSSLDLPGLRGIPLFLNSVHMFVYLDV